MQSAKLSDFWFINNARNRPYDYALVRMCEAIQKKIDTASVDLFLADKTNEAYHALKMLDELLAIGDESDIFRAIPWVESKVCRWFVETRIDLWIDQRMEEEKPITAIQDQGAVDHDDLPF